MSEVSLTRRWLRLEDEAIWTYGLIGARVPDLRAAARRQVTAHKTTRDRLLAVLASLGGEPGVAPPTYDVAPPDDAGAGRALAQDVEARIAACCVRLVAVTTDDARDRATAGLRTAALTGLRWDAPAEPFPGLA